MKRAFYLATTMLVVFARAVAFADPVTIVQDHRITTALARVHVTTESDFDSDNDLLTSTAIATVGASSSVASANLTSSFANPLHWFGLGTADGFTSMQGEAGTYSSSVAFGATFDLTSPVEYAFTGVFRAASSSSQPPPPGSGEAEWEISLTRPVEGGPLPLPTSFREQGTGPAVRSFSGTLLPDRYILFVVGRVEGNVLPAGVRSGNAGFNFTFDLTPVDAAAVPEPTSMLLLGTGLAGIFGYRRRSANRARG